METLLIGFKDDEVNIMQHVRQSMDLKRSESDRLENLVGMQSDEELVEM